MYSRGNEANLGRWESRELQLGLHFLRIMTSEGGCYWEMVALFAWSSCHAGSLRSYVLVDSSLVDRTCIWMLCRSTAARGPNILEGRRGELYGDDATRDDLSSNCRIYWTQKWLFDIRRDLCLPCGSVNHSDRAYVPENRPKHHQTSALLASAGKEKKHRRRVLEANTSRMGYT